MSAPAEDFLSSLPPEAAREMREVMELTSRPLPAPKKAHTDSGCEVCAASVVPGERLCVECFNDRAHVGVA